MKKLKSVLMFLMGLTMAFGIAACEIGNTSDSTSMDSITSDGGSSETPEDDFHMPTTEELAAMGQTLQAAYALEAGATMDGTHTLTGTVTNVAETGEGEARLTFVVEGYNQYPMYCYWLKGDAAGTLEVGDIITVTGTIKNYNGTIEFDKPTLDDYKKGEKPEDDGNDSGDVAPDDFHMPTTEELAAMGQTLEAAYALGTGVTMEGTHTLTGTVTNVAESKAGEARLTFVVEGYNQYPMYCYWLKGDAAGTLEVGDIITVTGTIKNYKGTIEFDKPTLDAYKKGEKAPLEIITTAGTGLAEGYNVISIEMAQAICDYVGQATTTDRYYIHATIDSVSNAKYGEMYISDETGSMKVYGTYSEDGAIGYANMTEKPYKGAEVLLSCTLHTFKDSYEIANARLIAFENITADQSNYTAMSVEEARDAADGALVKVEGVVAQITYASGMIPSGVYLVDNTNSIYVYDRDLAARVAVGNEISLLGKKTHWILDSETVSAAKFGYKGCNQIEDAWLLTNDEETNAWDKTWIKETTVKSIMETPVTEEITTTIYKVTALVKESVGADFVNYYIDDLDETTGSYVYTQCNGNDLAWLKEFDGKICTVYLSVINAKSSSTGCVWRFSVIAVEDNNFVFNTAHASKFVVEYYGLKQFQTVYTADPALQLTTSVSSALLGFTNATISYTSDNLDAIYFETVDGVTTMHCGTEYGTANVTITGAYNGNSYSETIVIKHEEPPKFNAITVAQAIATAPDTEVTVKGIVGPSLVNQPGFYLFSEEGDMIAVKASNKEVFFENLAIGNEVIIKGMRERYIKDDTYTTTGQTCIVDAEILANNYGSHEYSTAKFVTGKTPAELYALDATVDYSTTVFVVTGKLTMPTGNSQPSINGADGSFFSFYCSGVGQYSWLNAYAGQEVTLEVAACNWNSKTYWRGCVLAVRLADGTKVLNTLNFNL